MTKAWLGTHGKRCSLFSINRHSAQNLSSKSLSSLIHLAQRSRRRGRNASATAQVIAGRASICDSTSRSSCVEDTQVSCFRSCSGMRVSCFAMLIVSGSVPDIFFEWWKASSHTVLDNFCISGDYLITSLSPPCPILACSTSGGDRSSSILRKTCLLY